MARTVERKKLDKVLGRKVKLYYHDCPICGRLCKCNSVARPFGTSHLISCPKHGSHDYTERDLCQKVEPASASMC